MVLTPNQALEPTPRSVHCAPASGRGSPRALGHESDQSESRIPPRGQYMFIDKRPPHQLLKVSENLIDVWARNLVSDLSLCPEIAAYLLVLTACGFIKHQVQTTVQAGDPHLIEGVVRQNLFGLEWGLRTIGGLPSSHPFNEES